MGSLRTSKMTSSKILREKYTRYMPTSFCPGCGHGIVLNAFIHALDYMQLRSEEVVAFSGIGCSGWVTSPHLKADTFHGTHGRAIPAAIGAKIHNPKLNVFVFTGDGDCSGIGGNHLIHAARRNIDLTVLLLNNNIYGMTGGQVSPATPQWSNTATTEAGNPEHPFDLVELVKGAGASYIARWTSYHVKSLMYSIVEGYLNKGFTFIEVLTPCPTQMGRRNPNLMGKKSFDMLQHLKENTTRDFDKAEETEKIPIGVFVNKDPRYPSFLQAMNDIKEQYLERINGKKPKGRTLKSVVKGEIRRRWLQDHPSKDMVIEDEN